VVERMSSTIGASGGAGYHGFPLLALDLLRHALYGYSRKRGRFRYVKGVVAL